MTPAGCHRARRHRNRRRVADTAVTVFMVAAVALAVAAVGARLAGIHPLVEQSGSMQPVIAPGDLLLSRTVTAQTLRRGDIVNFADPDRGGLLISHRVVGLARTGDILTVETRGDANTASERWSTSARAQLGATILVLPKAGYLVRAVSRPPAVGGLVAMIVLLGGIALRDAGTRRRAARAAASGRARFAS